MTNVQIIVEGLPPLEFDAADITCSESMTRVTFTAEFTEDLKRSKQQRRIDFYE